ncbi:3-oxoacyl-ACP reductase [Lactococcus hircilactis]|uniref:3-oxoacyl-ACP reductase n=1 Tax=Lactococcus hircilactis TaxID=1494462 RepID=A0A7X2D2A0_9LACT|nr:3-oxoacyl-ACP reductase [Lactococcus hircilactis]MQW39865.1 3-oxoacyl-ACP reductase [Lactococcus hircilactis]
MTTFAGKKVLVTGSSSGIGQAQIRAFRKAGANVIGVDLHSGTETDFVCDLSVLTEVESIAKSIGSIDILCNTAGILDQYCTLENTSAVLWDHVLKTNLYSMFYLIQQFLPKMKAQKSGVIINMASIAGLVAGGGGIAYTASKHAIVGLTKQLAIDEAKSGIQVLGIAPGAIDTPMNARDFTENDGQMAKWVANETPAKRWATADEVAELTLFLASPKASYMTGAIVPIDGGWTAQ